MPNSAPSIRKLYIKDTSFDNLMAHRIFNVLTISSRYDAFMLEEDGRIDEQLFNEYASLNLRYPPRFTQVYTEEGAFEELKEKKFELVIAMSDCDAMDIFDMAKRIKARYADIMIVVLTPFSRQISLRLASEDLSAIDYVFSWLGNSDLLLAIIKLLEDRMNVERDVASVGVQVLLVVEDSVRFYSSILPYLYKFVFNQSRSFMTEALNAHQQMLRMRGRPKILLARSYEEAWGIYQTYQENVLGIISDVNFPSAEGEKKNAGLRLCKRIKSIDPFLPYIIQSSESNNSEAAKQLNVAFISKHSQTLPQELRKQMLDNFGFGDFIFRDPETMREIGRAHRLKDLQELVMTMPDSSIRYHFSQNHISKWLYSRAMFPLAEFVRSLSLDSFSTLAETRKVLLDAILQYRKQRNRGVIATFRRDTFDRYSNFARLGSGSMGGKARGLAFLDTLIKRNESLEEIAPITLPKTLVLCTDIFDDFMEQNNLYTLALSHISDEEMLQHFRQAAFPAEYREDFKAFLAAIDFKPLAVRSSSLLEDSYYQPFAGIYSTYMIPSDKDNPDNMLDMLTDAIKSVYASVFYNDSKAYMAATANVIDNEKMGVVLQELVGMAHGTRYYPSLSGVGRSINFYPIGAEKPQDGVVNVALGLGKQVVDGGLSLRFSPKYPENVLQTSVLSIALKETQTSFYAVDLQSPHFSPTTQDSDSVILLDLKAAEEDGTLQPIVSTYDPNDELMRDGLHDRGRKVVTFAGVLKYKLFPLAPLLQKVLEIGQREMGHPVEIEFAANLAHPLNKEPATFYLLQVRPIVENREVMGEDLSAIPDQATIISADRVLGNGTVNDVYDFVYVKPSSFNPALNPQLVSEIDLLNARLTEEGRHYVLVGPGRWGSSDPWLGIPVRWTNISAAAAIVEAGLQSYRVDPSQGTHFFHNLTTFRVGYFTINPYLKDGFYDLAFLDAQPAVYESTYIRHVRFSRPIAIKMDGKRGKGVVLKPKSASADASKQREA